MRPDSEQPERPADNKRGNRGQACFHERRLLVLAPDLGQEECKSETDDEHDDLVGKSHGGRDRIFVSGPGYLIAPDRDERNS